MQAVDQGGIGFHAKRDLAGYSFSFLSGFLTRSERDWRGVFLAASLDPVAIARRFTQRKPHARELTFVESLDNAHTARLLALCLGLEPSFALAAKRLLLLQFTLLSSPGIVTFVQGAEFFAPDALAAKPAPLRLADAVGRLRNGAWASQGAHWGFYEATRRLIALRRRFGWHAEGPLSQIDQSQRTEDPAILVMQAGTQSDPVLFVMNVAPRNHTEKP